MSRIFRGAIGVALVTWFSASMGTFSFAATPEEEAAMAAGRAWSKAIVARDVDAQMKLMPPTMFARPEDRDRARLQRIRDKEVALIKSASIATFELGAPIQSVRVGKTPVVVIPYKSVVSSSDGRIQTESSLIAFAPDGGSSWWVFDGSGHSVKTLKTIIPGYSAGINVPVTRSAVLKAE